MVVVTDLLTVARKVTNYDIDATGGGLWTDTTHYRVTVPVGKRWKFLGGYCNRDVSSIVNGFIYNASDKILQYMVSQTAAATGFAIPTTALGVETSSLYMDVGEYFEMTFAVAQGVGAYASFQVLEVDV